MLQKFIVENYKLFKAISFDVWCAFPSNQTQNIENYLCKIHTNRSLIDTLVKPSHC